jgi:radical SAM superfamily enzyme YgiQ (UPF0313 family)
MKKMKILFCTPPFHPYNIADEKIYITEPLQFEVLSSLIDKNKFEIEVLDLRLENGKNKFINKLKEFKPDILGLTSWTMHVNMVNALFKSAKDFDSSIITIVGGHQTIIGAKDLATIYTDIIMIGESYESFPMLMENLYNGNKDLSGIPCVIYKKDNLFINNGFKPLQKNFDLDNLPFPDRSIIKKYQPHYFHLWWQPIASVRTTLGCTHKCSFCNLWKPYNGKYMTWSSDYVVSQLSRIPEKYVIFVDDHFFGDVKRSYDIGEKILKKGIKKQYCFYSRSDTIARNPDLVKLWSKIGLKRVRMGLESYSDNTLDKFNKSNSIDNNDKAIKILKDNNVFTEGLFIISLDYKEKNFIAMEKYIQSRKIEVPNITVYCPMPGTDDFINNEDKMIYKEQDYFDFQHAVLKTELDVNQFCKLYSKLLIKAQRPPAEQIKLIGLKTFLGRIPLFWRYFLSVRQSYNHYKKPPIYHFGKMGLPSVKIPLLEVIESKV